MTIAIVKYNAGNTQSVIFALERIGVTPLLTNDPVKLQEADKVIFPGVGEAASTMENLKLAGLDQVLPTLKQPFLGICLGMQLMCRHSEERDTPCLDIFNLKVRKFVPVNGEKVPHMGWNNLTLDQQDPLLDGLNQPHMYFVHSYFLPENANSLASATYIHPFCAVIRKDNFYAVQFHPEKSGLDGQRLLKNFIDL